MITLSICFLFSWLSQKNTSEIIKKPTFGNISSTNEITIFKYGVLLKQVLS